MIKLTPGAEDEYRKILRANARMTAKEIEAHVKAKSNIFGAYMTIKKPQEKKMGGRHELKIWPQYFDAVIRGDKMFEVRGTDRDFQTGDDVRLREWDPKKFTGEPFSPLTAASLNNPPPPQIPRSPGVYTGRECTVMITYVLHGGNFGLPPEVVVFSFRPPDNFENEEGNVVIYNFNPEY
jgi:hypothetical protein